MKHKSLDRKSPAAGNPRPHHGPKAIMPIEHQKLELALQQQGVAALTTALQTSDDTKTLDSFLRTYEGKEALFQALIAEGERLLDDAGESPLHETISHWPSKLRLARLMASEDGREVMRALNNTREGEFLTINTLANSAGGPTTVAAMLAMPGGLKTAYKILAVVCMNRPDNGWLPQLPSYEPTAEGMQFAEQLSDGIRFQALLEQLGNKDGRARLKNLFETSTTEVRAILRNTLSNEEDRKRLQQAMESRGGRKFLGSLGKVGHLIASTDLWMTEGGRNLSMDLLQTRRCTEAIVALPSLAGG